MKKYRIREEYMSVADRNFYIVQQRRFLFFWKYVITVNSRKEAQSYIRNKTL
jgi:hypothetical protein